MSMSWPLFIVILRSLQSQMFEYLFWLSLSKIRSNHNLFPSRSYKITSLQYVKSFSRMPFSLSLTVLQAPSRLWTSMNGCISYTYHNRPIISSCSFPWISWKILFTKPILVNDPSCKACKLYIFFRITSESNSFSSSCTFRSDPPLNLFYHTSRYFLLWQLICFYVYMIYWFYNIIILYHNKHGLYRGNHLLTWNCASLITCLTSTFTLLMQEHNKCPHCLF